MQLLPVDAIKTISTHNRISKGLFVGLFLTLVCFLPEMAMAQSKDSSAPLTRILFVFDGSQSMYGRWKTGQKIKVAQKLLSELLDSISYRQDIQLALRVYGHQSPVISRENRDCEDTKLEVAFKKNNVGQIRKKLFEITPRGTTPIAYTLEKAAGDFPNCPSCRNIIILITDGIEECDGDPCAVSWALQQKGIVLKPFVIGMGVNPNLFHKLECIGDADNALKVLIAQ